MSTDERLISDRFPRASRYHPEWVLAGVSGGANPLWLTEWLTESLDLRPGMRVLDLGCGRALSSIFLRREFGVQVWATDLWFNAWENIQRVRDAGVEDGVRSGEAVCEDPRVRHLGSRQLRRLDSIELPDDSVYCVCAFLVAVSEGDLEWD